MKTMIVWFTTTMALLASPAHAEDGAPTVPQFEVDAFWPKPLPNKWILGQVSGIATDRYDRIWVISAAGERCSIITSCGLGNQGSRGWVEFVRLPSPPAAPGRARRAAPGTRQTCTVPPPSE